jgi:uncharacterized damage-inducible protein DinB
MLERLRRLFAYDAWANHETLRSFAAAASPPEKAVARMAHVVAAEWLWRSRIAGQSPPVAVWPKLSPADCERELARLEGEWRGLLDGMSEEGLARPVSYVNSKGEPWRSSVEDILMHTVMHSAYHRGQIASDLRGAGFEPAYTDYIHAVRQHLV